MNMRALKDVLAYNKLIWNEYEKKSTETHLHWKCKKWVNYPRFFAFIYLCHLYMFYIFYYYIKWVIMMDFCARIIWIHGFVWVLAAIVYMLIVSYPTHCYCHMDYNFLKKCHWSEFQYHKHLLISSRREAQPFLPTTISHHTRCLPRIKTREKLLVPSVSPTLFHGWVSCNATQTYQPTNTSQMAN